MKFKTEDGELIEGNSPIEIIEALRDGGRFTADQSIEVYMDGFAARWKEYSGATVSTESHDRFVEDLVSTGYIKAV